MKIRSVVLSLFLFLPLSGFTQDLQLADSLFQRGYDFFDKGQLRESEFYFKEAYQIYKQHDDPKIWLIPGVDYAEIQVHRSKYNQGIKLLKKMEQVASREKNIKVQGRIESDLGWAYNNLNQNEEALAHFKQAIPLAEQAKDSLQLGYIYNNIGGVYSDRGKYKKSLKYRQKSLRLKKRFGDPRSISITQNNIAVLYRKLLLYDEALKYYQQSLEIREKLNIADLLASVNNNLGWLFQELGEYDQALIKFQKSLEYQKKAGDPSGTKVTLNNIGTLYQELGQPEKALEYYRQSLQILENFGSPSSRATTISNIGARLRDLGQLKEAEASYQKALTLRRQVDNPRNIATSLLSLANLKIKQEDLARAEKYLGEAKIIADSTEDSTLRTQTANMMGKLAAAKENDSSAIQYYKQALEYSRELQPHDRLEIYKNLAYTFNRLRSDSALYYGNKVVEIVENQRSHAGSLPELKAGFLTKHVDFYVTMATWERKYRDDKSRAYHLVELAKARSLIDELAQAAKRIDEALPEDVRLQRAQQLAEISNLHSKLSRLPAGKESQNLQQKIREKELDYASFENRLQRKYSQYRHFKSPETVQLQKVQAMCDAETAVLEYAIAGGQLLGFLITENDVAMHQVSIDSLSGDTSSFANQVVTFRKAIFNMASEDSIRQLSAPLYKELVAPFEEVLAQIKNLIIIPDDYLAYLPFEVLSKNNNYLVSQYNIKYGPSMTGFSMLSPPKDRGMSSILTVGSSAQNSSDDMPMLPTVNMEVASVSGYFAKSTMLKDQQVTENKVKQALQQPYSVVHIAAHSVIDERNSAMSGIVLSKEKMELPRGIENDGYLRKSEIYRLNIPSDLVVLSACKSGMGDMVNGEGMLGLQRSFFNAGASTVVVSLWDVYDRSTTKFMKLFYSSLLNESGESWSDSWRSLLRWIGWDDSLPFGYSAAAMRKAKLAMLDDPEYHHPVYWAPFVVVGR